LTTGDNYSNYRGGKANDDNSLESQGKSKMQFCKDIGDLIVKAGCEPKSADAIKKKIESCNYIIVYTKLNLSQMKSNT
jgi:hypothetical protein